MNNRTILVVSILSVVLGLSLAYNIIQRQDTKELQKSKESLKNSLYELSMQKDSLQVANDSIQKILNHYMFLVDSLDVLLENNKNQVIRLNRSLNKALKEIEAMSSDEAYIDWTEGLDVSSTLVSGAEAYTINGDQVKEAYKNSVRVNYLDSMVIEQRKMVGRMSAQLLLKDNIITTLSKDNEAKKNLIEQLIADKVNLTTKLDMSEADVRRYKKALRMWQAGSVSAGGALLLILLLL